MMPSAIYMKIRDAILQKLTISADYDGYHREMCPHTLGVKRGREHALFYQFSGASKSGLGPDGSSQNWRCVDIAKLSNVQTRQGQWHTAPNHSRPQTCVDAIDVEVSG